MIFAIASVFSGGSIEWSVVIEYGIRILAVIIGFIVFRFILKRLMKMLVKKLEKKEVKNTLHSFIVSMISVAAWIVIGMIFLQILKVPLTPLITALGALGIALGLALKDHMSNIAGGVMIAVNKQFEVGDYIECSGFAGSVEDVEIFFTRLRTFDNKIVYAPNSMFVSNEVTNYTHEDIRRVDIEIGVSYNSAIDHVRETILNLIASNDDIRKDPEPFVGIKNYGSSSIDFVIRVWTDTKNFWNIYFYINNNLKKEFDKQNIEIPFPQLDVHTD